MARKLPKVVMVFTALAPENCKRIKRETLRRGGVVASGLCQEHLMEELRQCMAQSEAEGLEFIGPCPPNLCEAWIDIPLPNGQSSRTKVVWPKPPEGQFLKYPLVVYFHGGGFSTCSPDLVLAPARGFASVLSSAAACPSINQPPEYPFPVPVQTAWEICAWFSDANNLNNGLLKEAGVEVSLSCGFVVGGLSSGGGGAAVIAGMAWAISTGAHDAANLSPLQNPITGVFSGIPMLVTEAMLPARYKADLQSRGERAKDQVEMVAMLRDFEERIGDAVHSPWFSPINLDLSAPKTTQGHPKRVFTYSCTLDPLRDDAIIYKKWLSELQGVESRLCVLEGEHHTAWVSPPWPASHSRRTKEVTLDGMAWLLDLEWDTNQVNTLI